MKMRINIIFNFLILIGLSSAIQAQTAPGKYWIQFTDKNNSPYQLNHPEEFLSDRAIARRIQWNIPVSLNDLPVNQQYIDLIEQNGLVVVNRSKWMNAVTVLADSLQMQQIMQLPFVAQTNKVARFTRHEIPPFTLEDLHPLKSSFNRTSRMDYGLAANQIMMLNGDILHNSGYLGEGMVIAVLDAGFFSVDTLPAFDSLWANHQILGTWDFINNDSSVFEDYSHGMNVLSIMGGNIPGQLVGTAPKAKYWLLRSEEASLEYLAEEDTWIAAAEFADSAGADVINSSLGYSEFMDPSTSHVYADLDGNTTRVSIAADIAASKGMLLVNSAGNAGLSAWQYIIAPADADSVLAVGACDELGIYADFSSKGPSADGRVKPNVTAQGKGTVIQTSSGDVSGGNGTSYSSPVICGLATCLWQANPGLSAMQIMRAIEKSSSQYQNPDSLMGYGIPDFAKANLILNDPYLQSSTPSRIIQASPNPFRESLNLSLYLEDAKSVKAELIGMNGNIILSTYSKPMLASFQEIRFDNLGKLPDGIYLIRIYFNQQFQSIKVIKQ